MKVVASWIAGILLGAPSVWHVRRLAVTLAALVTSIAVCVVSAQGGVERVTSHGPSFRGFSAFAVNPRNAHVVYAGSGNGVFKSTDAGGSWEAVNVGLTQRYVLDLAIDQHRPATLYAATDGGVFKSPNGAGSWRKTSMPPGVEGRDAAVSLALHPRNSQVIYAGTDDRVYKSGDAGASWRKVKTARRVFAIVLDPKRPATVYAGSGGSVFKSTDAGPLLGRHAVSACFTTRRPTDTALRRALSAPSSWTRDTRKRCTSAASEVSSRALTVHVPGSG